MLITFAKHGQGSGAAAADYLLADRDHAGKKRAEVTQLRGDARLVAEVADSLDFEHRYRSAVIAWAPEDRPDNDQIEDTLDEFERVSWAGLEPDRYAWAAVLHRDEDGGAHVRVLAARVELETGKSHNIAPPGWEKTYGSLERALNREYGWARPDDPDRARTTRPGRFPADVADRDAIDRYLRQRGCRGPRPRPGRRGRRVRGGRLRGAAPGQELRHRGAPGDGANLKPPQDAANLDK